MAHRSDPADALSRVLTDELGIRAAEPIGLHEPGDASDVHPVCPPGQDEHRFLGEWGAVGAAGIGP